MSTVHRTKTNIIEITLDYMNIIGKRFQIIISFLGAEVTSAKDVLNFTWYKECLESSGNVNGSVRNVEITADEDKLKMGKRIHAKKDMRWS